jgi:hypothetical protein
LVGLAACSAVAAAAVRADATHAARAARVAVRLALLVALVLGAAREVTGRLALLGVGRGAALGELV